MQKRLEAAQRETIERDKIRFERKKSHRYQTENDYDQRFDKDFEERQDSLKLQDLEERKEFNAWMKQERSHLRQFDDKDRFMPGGDYTDRSVPKGRTQSGFPHREMPRAVAAEQMHDEFDVFQDTLHQSVSTALKQTGSLTLRHRR